MKLLLIAIMVSVLLIKEVEMRRCWAFCVEVRVRLFGRSKLTGRLTDEVRDISIQERALNDPCKFHNYDKNKDGVITKREFQMEVMIFSKIRRYTMAVFRVMDSDSTKNGQAVIKYTIYHDQLVTGQQGNKKGIQYSHTTPVANRCYKQMFRRQTLSTNS